MTRSLRSRQGGFADALQRFWAWSKLVISSFQTDQCLLRAGALTFVTSLSIVPFLAVAFSISKGFGFQNTEYIRRFLLKLSAGREVVVEHIITYINNTNVGTLGAMGVALLLITVFSMLGNIETSLNTIWGVARPRTLTRKFSDYLSVTLVCPLLVIAAMSFTASLESSALVQGILSVSVFSSLYLLFLKLLPVLLVSLAVFFMYLFIPNTRVEVKNCMSGALFAGVLWHLTQKGFIVFQVGMSKYNAIYGSFAQLPLFLIWLYVSWFIILLGAEVSFCLGHSHSVRPEKRIRDYALASRERMALGIMIHLSRRFIQGAGVLAFQDIVRDLQAPVRLVRQTLDGLIQLEYVVPVSGRDRESVCLAAPPEGCRLVDFLREFREYRSSGEQEVWIDMAGESKVLERMYELLAASGENRNLAELASSSDKEERFDR